MKLSMSLLKNNDIGEKIFNISISKVNLLLKQIFDLNVEDPDNNTSKNQIDITNHKYVVNFKFKDRDITAEFTYESEDDLVVEVLRIKESYYDAIIDFGVTNSQNFKEFVTEQLDYLEKTYDIDFTPLNPEDRKDNIKSLIIDENNSYFETIFTTNSHDSIFKATNKVKESGILMEIIEDKEHVIYFD